MLQVTNLVALADSLQLVIVHTSCIHISLRHSLENYRTNIESEVHAHLINLQAVTYAYLG